MVINRNKKKKTKKLNNKSHDFLLDFDSDDIGLIGYLKII